MSRIRRLLAAATQTPWAILPQKLDAIAEILTLRSTGEQYSEDDILARLGGEAGPPAKAAVGRGVAVLPLYGVIAPRMDGMTEMSGGTSTERFGAWFDAAMADESVSAIVIDANSPGGSVQGVEELARKIFAARGRKPIVAVVNHMAASAAYWIASAADEIVATLSAQLGNIGIIAMHADTSEADAKAGVKVTVLSAGKYKAEGAYGPLTPEATAAMNDLMATYYGYFTKAVARGRGVKVDAVRSGFGEGRIVTAADAVKAGMADSIGTLEDTIARFTSGRTTSRNLPGSRAALVPEHIAAALLADPAPSALTALLTLDDSPLDLAASAAPLLAEAVPGDAAPVVVPVTIPAPTAKESKMPEDVAATEAAALVKAAAEATQTRLDALSALATEFPAQASLPRWIKDGITVDAAKSEVMTQLKAGHAAAPRITSSGSPTVARVDGPANEAKRPFSSLGEQLQAIHRVGIGSPRADDFGRLMEINAAISGASESISSDGGFAVQQDFLSDILTPVYSTGDIASRVRRIPLGANANGVKFNIVDESSRAAGSRWGGIQFSFKGEGDQGSSSKPKLRPFSLDLKKAMGLYYATDELLDDSTAMQSLLSQGFETELQFFIEDQFYRGQGAGAPQGILNAPAAVTQAIEGGQTIANTPASVVLNATKMKTHMPPALYKTAIWMANPEFEPYLVAATLGGTSAAMPVYLQQGTLASPTNASLLGRPLIYSDYCEPVGTPGDFVLVNWGEYATTDKGGTKNASSVHLRFDYDETAFRITYRFDGSPLWRTSVTPYKGSAARSPIILLGTRS